MSDRQERADRGMTPVVGIVLLVAITLLLASTVAAFAIGIGEDQQSDRVPTVAVGFEYDRNAGTDDRLTIVHRSGQAVDASWLDVVVRGAECVGDTLDPDGRYTVDVDFGIGGSLKAGEMFRLPGSAISCPSNQLDLSGASVQVVWNPNNGGSSTLGRWHGPR